MKSQAQKRAGLFSCDDYRIFSDRDMELPNTQVLPQVVAQKGVAGALTATWVNANAFIAAWDQILTKNLFVGHEWVVKADPDCVFVTGRLRSHLSQPQFSGPAQGPLGVYLKNCAGGPRGLQLFGSMEVLSRNAVQTMKNNWGRCQGEVQHALSGEDMWLQQSLDMLHVPAVEDYNALVADGYCPSSSSPEVCSPTFMAYHPKKLPDQWLKCWEEANK